MQDKNDDLFKAMMLLELATDGTENDPYADADTYMIAAHSYIQKHVYGRHSWEGALELVVRILSDTLIQEVARSSRDTH